jgi:hypothetical protein
LSEYRKKNIPKPKAISAKIIPTDAKKFGALVTTDIHQIDVKDIKRVEKKEIAKVLTKTLRLGGGAGAKLGTKVSKTDLTLPKIPAAGAGATGTSA